MHSVNYLEKIESFFSIYRGNRISWVGFCFVLLFVSQIVFIDSATGSSSIIGSKNIIRLALVGGGYLIVLFLCLLRPRFVFNLFRPPLCCFFVYVVTAFISTLYSSHELYTAWKASELLLLVLACSFFTRHSFVELVNVYRVIVFCVLLLLLCIVVLGLISPDKVLVPSKGILPFQMGGIMNPNALGSLAALGCIFTFSRYLYCRKKVILSIFLISLVVLILASSRTSILSFFCATVVLLLATKQAKLFFCLLFLVVSISVSTTCVKYVSGYWVRGQTSGSLKSLSGRTVAWKKAWKYFKKKPLVGHGFASAGRYDILNNASSHLHSSYFEALVGVGLVGVIPYLMALLLTGIKLFRLLLYDDLVKGEGWTYFRAELFSVYIMLIVRSITTSNLAELSIETIVLMLLVSFSMFNWDVLSE